MPEDWAAVAAAIDARVRELGWRQRELSERAKVSHAIVREIQHHVVERRRSARTLEALSTALGAYFMAIKRIASVKFVELPTEYTFIVELTQRHCPNLQPVILHTRGAKRFKRIMNGQKGYEK